MTIWRVFGPEYGDRIRGRCNSWIKGLVFIGDDRKTITRKYKRKNDKNSKKEDKNVKVKKSNKSRLNSL